MDWLNTELSGEKLLSFYLEASDISSTDQHKFIVDFNITFFFSLTPVKIHVTLDRILLKVWFQTRLLGGKFGF